MELFYYRYYFHRGKNLLVTTIPFIMAADHVHDLYFRVLHFACRKAFHDEKDIRLRFHWVKLPEEKPSRVIIMHRVSGILAWCYYNAPALMANWQRIAQQVE